MLAKAETKERRQKKLEQVLLYFFFFFLPSLESIPISGFNGYSVPFPASPLCIIPVFSFHDSSLGKLML